MAGIDPRPEARVLPARTIAEIHYVMHNIHGVHEFEHRLEYVDDDLVAIYFGKNNNGRSVEQAFDLVTPTADPRSYGSGISQVMCGGMIAYMMDSFRSTLEENFHLGTRQGLYERTPDIIHKFNELLKMIDDNTGKISAKYFRTGFAPRFVKSKPFVITKTWLEETKSLFEAFAAGPAP
ncbi:MAG: hypothetical protein U0930_11525 [Pirellulales bacterium]